MATNLSVNINKVALLRNARGGHLPNLTQVAIDAQKFGAQGITVHPRPDQRHIRYDDIITLSKVIQTEYNIEGNPNAKFIDLVLEAKPDQVTLVPDSPDQLTSDHGWDTIKEQKKLIELIGIFHDEGIRTSIFIDTNPELIRAAADTGTERIELYTGPFAEQYITNPIEAVGPYQKAAILAHKLGLGVNAGHDLNQENLAFFKLNCANLLEVSIGHALISDALYDGLETTIKNYLSLLN